MAIDADLNAGLIDENEARTRRQSVASEADFYGSMDGASKFVRGDAIASILITLINIGAGIIIGVSQHGMDIGSAAQTFTLLTVGDGLVSQIPATIVSLAAGILTTRNANDGSLAIQIEKQLKIHPRVLYIGGGILFFLGALPGIPLFPFLLMACVCGLGGYLIVKGIKEEEDKLKLNDLKKDEVHSENLEKLLDLELVELEVGYGLVSLVDSEQNGDLLERISHIRKQFALDWGVIVPFLRIRDNLELKPGGYSMKIKGIEVAKGELMTDCF